MPKKRTRLTARSAQRKLPASMSTHQRHAAAVSRINRLIVKRGGTVPPTVVYAIRVSSIKEKTQNVTVRGKRYSYVYPFAFWNLLARNQIPADENPPDVWILTITGRKDVWIVPYTALANRKNVELQMNRTKPRGHILDLWKNRWDLIGIKATA